MKRRDFFKQSTVVAAAGFVAPYLLTSAQAAAQGPMRPQIVYLLHHDHIDIGYVFTV